VFQRISNMLDRVYKVGAWAAGGLLLLLCGLVLYSILARLVGFFAGGATDVAGYVMATSTFLALAYTFRSEGHIRVALLIQKFTGNARRRIEIFCYGIMSAVTIFIAYYMYRLAYDSYEFGDRSQGADAILMWIPQTPVAIGAILLAISVLHSFAQSIFDYEAINPETSEKEGPGEV